MAKNKKMDDNLVAYKEDCEREVKYIATRYKIPVAEVRAVMKALGSNGKMCRSRFMIYAELRKRGYEIKTRYTK